MDNSHHYSSNVINTSSAASYPSPANISPTNHLQNGSHLQNGQHQTLPSLHHNPAMSMYASHPHTPRTPATPNTPNSMGSYAPPPAQQNAGRPSYPMMHNPYQQHQQSYATSSAMMPQSSVSSAHPQPIAPAPSPGGRVPPVLRPMPAGGVMPQSGLNSPYAQSPMMGQPSLLQESDQPTHVVGSQGRRGILPSAPGRPAPPAPGSAAAKAQVPQKDADGKFPCPHCTKTYLHAKHLSMPTPPPFASCNILTCVIRASHAASHGRPSLHVCLVPRHLQPLRYSQAPLPEVLNPSRVSTIRDSLTTS